MKEFDFIKTYLQRKYNSPQLILGIGDDAAIIRPDPNYDIHISSDMLLAGRHFFADVAPEDLAYKVLAVNLSDMAAMGATPKWVLLSIALPELNQAWLTAFCDSFFALAEVHDVILIGGDTTKGDLAFNLTILGQTPTGTALRRDAAQVGDDIWVSGELGSARAALEHKLKQVKLTKTEFTICEAKLLRPTARVELGNALLAFAHAAQDISDGFAQDLSHILTASNVGARIEVAKLPMLASLQQYTQHNNWSLSGGDDYELVFTVSANDRDKVLAASEASNTEVTRVGVITEELGLQLIDQMGKEMNLSVKGFDHFGK